MKTATQLFTSSYLQPQKSILSYIEREEKKIGKIYDFYALFVLLFFFSLKKSRFLEKFYGVKADRPQ